MKFLLADDHSIIRNALRYMIEEIAPNGDICEAASFDAIERIIQEQGTEFDLVIVDLRMPGFTDPQQLKELVDRLSPTPVVVFSMLETTKSMREALGMGIKAFIPKSIEDAQISSIIKLVLSGGTYVPAVLSGLVSAQESDAAALYGGQLGANDAMNIESHPAWAHLTKRQRDVLLLLGEGKSNNEISESLGLTLSTVKTHVSGVLKSLGVDNRTQAVLMLKNYLEAPNSRSSSI